MSVKKGIVSRFAAAVDLQDEPFPGMPLIEIAGTGRVLIEHHMGVIKYDNTEICVKVKYGIICVLGFRLELAKMTKEQLIITGTIDGVKLQRRER